MFNDNNVYGANFDVYTKNDNANNTVHGAIQRNWVPLYINVSKTNVIGKITKNSTEANVARAFRCKINERIKLT